MIEDEASIASAIATRLRSEGYEVEIAGDGPGGVELCERFRPDLVVLDLMLPGLDGIEVCKQIQRDRPLPVLMLTARDTETDLLVGLARRRRRLHDEAVQRPRARRARRTRCCAAADRAPARDAATRQCASARSRSTPRARRVRCDGELVHLTPIEFDLLAVPRGAARPGREPRGAARARCGATTCRRARAPSTRTSARCAASSAPTVVRTVHGVGYAVEDGRIVADREAGVA